MLLSCGGCVLTRDQGNEFSEFLVLIFFDGFPCLFLSSHGTRDAHSCGSHTPSHESSQSTLDTLQFTSHMLTRILTLVVFLLM